MVNPSRVAFTLFGKDIYWYGVLMAFGIVVAVLLAMREAKRRQVGEDTVLDLCLVLIPSGVVGARLYYVLFDIKQYLAEPLRILYIWEGGLAIYGAVIGGLIGLAIYARVKKIRFLKLADIFAPGLVLAQAIGRWGNFFNQEAYGLPVTQEMIAKLPFLKFFPFGVKIEGIHYFNGKICTACYESIHLATFFYESMWCVLVFLFLWFILRKRVKHDGDVFIWYAMLYGFERMFIEGLRADSLTLFDLHVGGAVVRISQVLAALVFVCSLVFLLVRRSREKKLGRLIWPMPEQAAAAALESAILSGIEKEKDDSREVPGDEPSGGEKGDESSDKGKGDEPSDKEEDGEPSGNADESGGAGEPAGEEPADGGPADDGKTEQ